MADMPREVRLNIKTNPTEPAPGAKIAKVLQVVNEGGHHAQLYIDGELFPWATVEGFTVHAGKRAQIPAVHVSIAAYRVEVVDDLNRPSPIPDVAQPDKAGERICRHCLRSIRPGRKTDSWMDASGWFNCAKDRPHEPAERAADLESDKAADA